MPVNPLITLPATATATALPTAAVTARSGFQATLEKITPAVKQKTEARKQAEEAAAGLVSNALILPILKQVRRSPFNTDGPFSPGNGEKTFGPQFDMQLSDRIAHCPRLGITNALADRLMKQGQPAKAATIPLKELDIHG